MNYYLIVMVGLSVLILAVFTLFYILGYQILKSIRRQIQRITWQGQPFKVMSKLNLMIIIFLVIFGSVFYSFFFLFSMTQKIIIDKQKEQELLLVFDLDNSQKLDAGDFEILFNNWGASENQKADFNRDRKIDLIDFNILLSNFK